jgi:23S rRNA (guanosine2251-2'-O)-methyltransferase
MERAVVYGTNPVLEALAASVAIEEIYIAVGIADSTRARIQQAAKDRGVRVFNTNRRELDRMSQGGVHQGVLAVCGRPSVISLEQLQAIERPGRKLVLALDEVQDPHNLGALARSALAFGAQGIVIQAHRSAGISAGAIKASAGALSRVPVARVTNLSRALEELKTWGYWIVGAVAHEGQSPWEFDPGEKVVLVLGSEGFGLRNRIQSLLDFRVLIPLNMSAESLNVSVAGALLLYEWLGRGSRDR